MGLELSPEIGGAERESHSGGGDKQCQRTEAWTDKHMKGILPESRMLSVRAGCQSPVWEKLS